jgi:drug/metabolite transporter (DMT)-like permease
MAAATFGVADFLGGTAARRTPSAVVAVLAQLAGLAALLVLLPLLPAVVDHRALAWGLLAGLAGGVGVPLLYRGLAEGPMNVVAPLTALTSAGVPVLAGTLLGERPSAAAWLGIGLAVVAGVLVGVTAGPSELPDPDDPSAARPARPARRVARGVALALFAGACFGGFFVLIAQAAPTAGLWPVATARVSGSLVAALVLVTVVRAARSASESGAAGSVRRPGWWLAAACGVLDATANAVYLLAVQHGELSVVGGVVALYPASTVLLARVWHGERIGRVQRVGLALAVPALLLVGGG